MKDYYKILNVSQNASIKEIVNSYIYLKSNTDTNQEELEEAFEILSNLHKRKSYDLNYKKSLQNINSKRIDYKTITLFSIIVILISIIIYLVFNNNSNKLFNKNNINNDTIVNNIDL